MNSCINARPTEQTIGGKKYVKVKSFLTEPRCCKQTRALFILPDALEKTAPKHRAGAWMIKAEWAAPRDAAVPSCAIVTVLQLHVQQHSQRYLKARLAEQLSVILCIKTITTAQHVHTVCRFRRKMCDQGRDVTSVRIQRVFVSGCVLRCFSYDQLVSPDFDSSSTPQAARITQNKHKSTKVCKSTHV